MKIEEGSRILLVDLAKPQNRYLVDTSIGVFSTSRGQIDISATVGMEYGTVIISHLGEKYIVLKPTIYDEIMLGIRRKTQIVYPKDAGYIVLWLGLEDGMRVFECGAGSGAMTAILANSVKPNGIVVSYEKEERFFKLAQKNLERLGLIDFVQLKCSDIEDIEDENEFDAAFIDIREPWEHTERIWNILIGSGTVAFVLPTTNQVQKLLLSLKRYGGFIDLQVAEVILRFYKPVPERLRPEDRMVAHTAFIIMARKFNPKE